MRWDQHKRSGDLRVRLGHCRILVWLLVDISPVYCCSDTFCIFVSKFDSNQRFSVKIMDHTHCWHRARTHSTKVVKPLPRSICWRACTLHARRGASTAVGQGGLRATAQKNDIVLLYIVISRCLWCCCCTAVDCSEGRIVRKQFFIICVIRVLVYMIC